MTSVTQLNSEVKWWGKGLSVVALWVGLVVFVVPRIDLLFQVLQRWPAILDKVIRFFGGLFGIPIFFVYVVLASSQMVYLMFCLFIAIGLMFALIQRSHDWFNKALSILTLLSLLWFMFSPYTTTVQPAKNHQMTIVTLPSFLQRGFKRSQSIAETKPCRYLVLGWQNHQLYYNAKCGSESSNWQFNIDLDFNPVLVQGELPAELYTEIITQEET